jgi:integrase
MATSQKPGEKLVDVGRQPKAVKGTVKVEADKGWLRLRFTHQGQRYTFALGLINSKLHRDIAADRARKIELDILSGNFDQTLAKYKPQPAPEKTDLNLVKVRGLMEQFIQHKSKQVYARTLEKYHAILNHLEAFQPHDGTTNLNLM